MNFLLGASFGDVYKFIYFTLAGVKFVSVEIEFLHCYCTCDNMEICSGEKCHFPRSKPNFPFNLAVCTEKLYSLQIVKFLNKCQLSKKQAKVPFNLAVCTEKPNCQN